MATPRDQDMEAFTLPLPRGPLSARAERIIVILATLATLLAAPIAVNIGTTVYGASRQAYIEQAQTRHSVTATVIGLSPDPDPHRNSISVDVRWTVAGTPDTGTLRVDPSVEPGDTVEVWVNDAGRLVGAPVPVNRAAMDGVVVAMIVWLMVASTAALTVVGVRKLQARLRDTALRREIDDLFHGVDG